MPGSRNEAGSDTSAPGSSVAQLPLQREELLNLLDQQARDAFERAKRIALENGGVVTPLHIWSGF